RGELRELDAAASIVDGQSVDGVEADECVELLALAAPMFVLTRLADRAGDGIALAQTVLPHHRGRDVDVVRAREVTGSAQERIVVMDVEDAADGDEHVVVADVRLVIAATATLAVPTASATIAAVVTVVAVVPTAVVAVVAVRAIVASAAAVVAAAVVTAAAVGIVAIAVLGATLVVTTVAVGAAVLSAAAFGRIVRLLVPALGRGLGAARTRTAATGLLTVLIAAVLGRGTLRLLGGGLLS